MNFNDSNLECSYIENLLYNFNTPTIRILPIEEKPFLDEHYIKNGSIYTYRKPNKKEIEEGKDKDTYYNFFDYNYSPGEKYLGLTRNHISESNNYNSSLHEALGDYLRFIKDFYKMDLMPLYNCFSNRFIDTFSLPIDDQRRKGSTIKEGTKLFAFPIKYGKTYSIFCKNNCNANVLVAFFNKKRPLEIKQDEVGLLIFPYESMPISQLDENKYNIKRIEEYEEYFNPSRKEEIKLSLIKILRTNEVNLYLLVEIPSQNIGNIVIIENNSSAVVNNSLIENHLQQPFSEKLMGYLLNYYITPMTSIQLNIERIQKMLSSNIFYVKDRYGKIIDSDDSDDILPEGMTLKNTEYVKGNFDYITRNFIYNLYRFAGIPDFTGYVDKDVEALIIRDSKENE